MSKRPQAAAPMVEITPNVSAVAPGVLWIHACRALVAADVHFGYEDVIGAALPAWSAREIASTLVDIARRMRAREIILLGDVIHGSRMSEGAAAAVRRALDALRRAAQLTLVAGNHEGRTRGAAVLGETVDFVERDGWLLLHGDRPNPFVRCIIGHLHPSLALGGAESAPAFLVSQRLIVLPALTPYSGGLDVLSDACLRALHPWNLASRADLQAIVAAGDLLYPFGSLSKLRSVI